MKLLGTFSGASIFLLTATPGERVFFVGDMDIDCDGSGGNPAQDPYFQPDTSYHVDGKALNAYEVRFVVVPPIVLQATKGIVLGCRCIVTHLINRRSVEAVVGDIGPKDKDGEGSPALASALGLNPNPNNGGTDELIIAYEIFPGVPAMVDGKVFRLQPYRA